MEPRKRLDALWIAERRLTLRPQGLALASEQAKTEFVQMVLDDNPALNQWRDSQRFFTCPKCHTETIAAATTITCNCGTEVTTCHDYQHEARLWVLLCYHLGEMSEGYAAAELKIERLDLRAEVIARFGSLYHEDVDEQPSTH